VARERAWKKGMDDWDSFFQACLSVIASYPADAKPTPAEFTAKLSAALQGRSFNS
jgi:hypothetical protein